MSRKQKSLDSTISRLLTAGVITVVIGLLALAGAFLVRDFPALFGATPTPIPPTYPPAEHLATTTPTATFTPTRTQRPTQTRIPTITLTPTLTSTATPVTPTKIPTITLTPLPTNTLAPTDRPYYWPVLRYLDGYARAIYELGQTQGIISTRFSKIGDSESYSARYLTEFGTQNYDLDQFSYLDPTIHYFETGSFQRSGYANYPAWTTPTMFDPQWSDKSVCHADEGPLVCEYRIYRPAIALIMLRTWTSDMVADGQYEHELRTIVLVSAQSGVIPVLSTLPVEYSPWPPSEPMNEVIRKVAWDMQVPLWDFAVTSNSLSNGGVDPGSNHLNYPYNGPSSFFTSTYLGYGTVRRNLEALIVLHEILNKVMLR